MRARLMYILLLIGAALAAAIYFYRQYREQSQKVTVERKVREEATEAYGEERATLQRDIDVASMELKARKAAADEAVADWTAKLERARKLKDSWQRGG